MTQILLRSPKTSIAPSETSATGLAPRKIATALQQRRFAITTMFVVCSATMAYTLLWGPLVNHHSYWITPGDLWGTFRTAQMVSWGDIGDVYNSGAGLVTFPGISVVLAPVALLVGQLHLATSYPFGIAHPSAWWVLGPFEAVVGSIVLIPLDALAEEIGVGRRGRLVALAAGAVILFPVLAMWGHPEDTLALAFAAWGLVAVLRGRWRTMGWLFGLALAMQPLVILVFPVVIATTPVRQWVKFALRSAAPGASLVAIPLAQSWRATTTALLKQPNFPTIDHPTPWLSLAPTLTKNRLLQTQHFIESRKPDGSGSFHVFNSHTIGGLTVAAGPGRLIAIGLALVLGVYAVRRRPDPTRLVWLCAVALSLRCVFEAVMNPYYLWPPLALACCLVARDWRRFATALVAGGFLTWWSYHFVGPWEWWAPVVTSLGLVMVASYPGSDGSRSAGSLAGPRRRANRMPWPPRRSPLASS